MKNVLIKLSATWFGVGYGPLMPGTYGTFFAIPLYWFLQPTGAWAYVSFTVVFIAFSCWVSGLAGPLLGETDSPHIVIDEVAGFLVTMAFLPRTWQAILIGFVVFRILDSTKPGPIRWFEENIPGGTGVVLDDVAAGVFGNLFLLLVFHFNPALFGH